MPALRPGVHVYRDHKAARHGLPADLGLGTAPPGSPPLTPAPSEAVAADRAEDQDCPERSYTRKSRPSGDPVSHPLSCFTVFQTRTLGWDWGFFLPTSQMGGWKEKNWRREAGLPFRGRLRHGGVGVDAGHRAGVPLTPPRQPGPLCTCRPEEPAWAGRQRLLSLSECAGRIPGAKTMCGLPGRSAIPVRRADSQGETRQSYRSGSWRQGLAEPRGGGGRQGAGPAAAGGSELQEAPSGALLRKLFQQHCPVPPSPAPQTRPSTRTHPRGLQGTQERTQRGRGPPRGPSGCQS